MFKDWEEMKMLSKHLVLRMDEKNADDLKYWINFAEYLSPSNRRSVLYPILSRRCRQSNVWDGKETFRKWIENELKELKNMIEYYGENKYE